MAVEKYDNTFSVCCDFCGNSADGMDSFKEAIDWKKLNWASFNFDNEWHDVCPCCIARLKTKDNNGEVNV